MTLERGTLLNNRYRIVEILGQGGMGAVYRAVDENLGVEVAAKENLFTTEEYARQFRREAVILANLRHPNLPRVTDHFVIEDQGQYLIMDYIEGEDLRQRMDRLGVVLEEEAIMIGAAVCDALSYLDSRTQPIVHRDIKPGNIKITPSGHIFLVDFGLAKVFQGSQVTTTGARAMTPGYSPPEQYGTARTDNRSDLFSLGATLYAAVTGAIPEDALARAMQQAELTTIRKHNPKISRRLASVLEKSLEIRPDNRFQTAEEFKQALLSVRNVARRNTGEYTVPPPPKITGNAIGGPNSQPVSSPAYEAFPGTEDDFLEISSAPVVDPTRRSRPQPRRQRGGGMLLALGFVVIFFVATALIYTYYPYLPARAMSLLFPGADTDTPASQTMLAAAANATATDTPTPTLAPTLTPTTTQPPPTATNTPRAAAPVALVSTPTAHPTPLGGGGGVIAYASDQTGVVQVWTMNVDGTEPFQVTNMPEGACQPVWSPDGTRLAFISPCERNQTEYPGAGLFIINADGTGLTPLPSMPGGDFDPAWSPDGRWIAFTSLRVSKRPRIYLYDLVKNEATRLSEQYSRDSQPAWSPDGEQIAFVSTRKGVTQIWVMDADGRNQRAFSQSQAQINTHPIWSLDGELLLFTQAYESGDMPSLAAASYSDDQYSEFRYDIGPIPVREAKYSPDGLWLAFESWPEGSNHDIYIMAASGAGRIQLTNHPRLDFDVDWRPVQPQP